MCKPTLLSKDVVVVDNNEKPSSTTTSLSQAKKNLSNGTLYACISLILLISAFSLLMPFAQARRDDLRCDTLCQGSMTSVRSTLSLIGSALMGRLSDVNKGGGTRNRLVGSTSSNSRRNNILNVNGRLLCLYIGTVATLMGFIISAFMNNITGMWLGMIPGALLQQNLSVYKALLADYHEEISQLETKSGTEMDGNHFQAGSDDRRNNSKATSKSAAAAARAGSVGKLGMSVGLSFMVGPLLGSTMITTYQSAVMVSSLLTLISAIWIMKMPTPSITSVSVVSTQTPKNEDDNDKIRPKSFSRWKTHFMKMINVKSAMSKPALFLMTIRLCMALAFHIFNLIWTVSLKKRFNFGPSDHGKFMSYIGLVFALSQGFLAKRILAPFGNKGRINVILVCCLALGVGRVVAFQVNDLRIVYVMFGFIVTSLGVVNTVLTADTCLIAPSSEIGGIYGVLEAAQSAAGMFGPFIGGLLAQIDPVKAPLCAVVGLYAFVFMLVSFGYEKLILNANEKSIATNYNKKEKKEI